MNEANVVRSLVALAQDARLRIFRALVASGNDGLTQVDSGEKLGVAASTLSFHLKELTNSGLVSQERQGRHLIYSASIETMNELLGYLTENCCQGEVCLTSPTIFCNRELGKRYDHSVAP